MSDRDTFGAKPSYEKVSAAEHQITKHGIHKLLEDIVAFCPEMTGVPQVTTRVSWQDVQDTLGDLLVRIDHLRPQAGEDGEYE